MGENEARKDKSTRRAWLSSGDHPRLDRFIQEHLDQLSRSQIQRLIASGQALHNGKVCQSPAQKLRTGDRIELSIPPPQETELKAEDIPLEILYEDGDLIVLNKSAELVVHPGAGNREGTLVHALLHHCRDLSGIGGLLRPGIVHRLDKGTSGVLLAAKNDLTHLALSRQFAERQIEKTYLAWIWGRLDPPAGSIDLAVGRSRTQRKKMSVSSPRGREALTEYALIRSIGPCSLVELKPKTGRTHQLRVHLSALGHPIVGDPLYGSAPALLKPELKAWLRSLRHQLLHAQSIRFFHPTLETRMEYDCVPRSEFRNFEALLESQA